MKLYFKVFVMGIVLCFSFSEMRAQSLNIAFINGRSYTGFWKQVEDFLNEVANDFNDVKVTIYRANSDHFEQIRILEEITSPNHKTKYNAVMTRSLKQNGLSLIEIAEKNQVPLFIFSTKLTEAQIAETGGPRKKYKYYLGEMAPDDESIGYQSAKELYRIAKQNNIKGKNSEERIELLAICGSTSNMASNLRLKGLNTFIAETNYFNLLQVLHMQIFDDNVIESTANKVQKLQERHKGVPLIWAFNDRTSIGAINSIERNKPFNLIPGKNFFSGGIDWDPTAIDMVEKNEMAYTFGGHFMDGGWSFILIYDYLNGMDFITEGLTFNSKMNAISKDNISDYKKLFQENQVKQIDFKKFSKFRNPALKKYEFSFNALLKNLN